MNSNLYPTLSWSPESDGERTSGRKRLSARAWIAVAATVALGLAAAAYGLVALLSGSAPQTPAGIVRADGYSVTMTMDNKELADSGAFTGDTAFMKAWVVSIATGTRGDSEEAVAQLTDSGRTAMSALVPAVNASSTSGEKVHLDGSMLIFNGPTSSFSGGMFGK